MLIEEELVLFSEEKEIDQVVYIDEYGKLKYGKGKDSYKDAWKTKGWGYDDSGIKYGGKGLKACPHKEKGYEIFVDVDIEIKEEIIVKEKVDECFPLKAKKVEAKPNPCVYSY